MKQWFGGNDAKTSASYFEASNPNHTKALHAVIKMLNFLKNGRHIELIYIDDESENKVVAYRFTSDRSYDIFWWQLMRVGGTSLGRGVWNPHGDEHQYKHFFGCPSCGKKVELMNEAWCKKCTEKAIDHVEKGISQMITNGDIDGDTSYHELLNMLKDTFPRIPDSVLEKEVDNIRPNQRLTRSR